MEETFRPDQESASIFSEFNAAMGDKFATASILKREMKKAGLEFYEQSFTFSHPLIEGNGVCFRPI